jgi:hypothetical protein
MANSFKMMKAVIGLLEPKPANGISSITPAGTLHTSFSREAALNIRRLNLISHQRPNPPQVTPLNPTILNNPTYLTSRRNKPGPHRLIARLSTNPSLLKLMLIHLNNRFTSSPRQGHSQLNPQQRRQVVQRVARPKCPHPPAVTLNPGRGSILMASNGLNIHRENRLKRHRPIPSWL